jgi:hypothetical protein
MITKIACSLIALAACASAGSVTIDISATQDGCSQCNSPQNILPGTVLTDIFTPKLQLTLGPGTYTITNGDTTPGDTYSAWNFQGPVSTNWVWSFVVANNSTGVVLMDDYIAGVFATQALAAGATGIATYDGNTLLSGTSTAGFVDTLTLASTTTLDFFVDDYYLGDNAGGAAVTVTGNGIGATAPEPSALIPLGAALLGLACWRRR